MILLKVFVATLYNRNYGSALQAFALQTMLKDLGGDPVIVAPEAKRTGNTILEKIKFYFRAEKHYGPIRKIRRSIEKRLYAEKAKKINAFINKGTRIVSYKEAVESMQKDKCVLLAGSDQIWSILNHPIDDFFLFDGISNENATRASYAASIGVSELSEEQKQYYKRVLEPFDFVSFRESQALELLQPVLTNREVRQDLDPTLLFDGVFWDSVIPAKKENKPFVFIYMVRPNHEMIKIARDYAKERGLEIVYIGQFFNKRYPGIETVTNAGVEDFLYYMRHADFVVTNSFHGTIFSLLFHKEFVSVRVESTGSRAENLLKIVGLEDHLVSSKAEYQAVNQDVDYDIVDRILEAQRHNSISYLDRLIHS